MGVCFCKGKPSTTRRWAAYRRHNGHNHSKVFMTEDEAISWEAGLKAQIEAYNMVTGCKACEEEIKKGVALVTAPKPEPAFKWISQEGKEEWSRLSMELGKQQSLVTLKAKTILEVDAEARLEAKGSDTRDRLEMRVRVWRDDIRKGNLEIKSLKERCDELYNMHCVKA